MCEFCKYGERNSVVDDNPFFNDNKDVVPKFKPEIWIQEAREEDAPDRPKLVCLVSIASKLDSKLSNTIYTSMEIKYCPICGRKLEEF